MNLRNFKIGWRLLISQPAYSAVVIFGLSVGFATCFLLLSYVRYSDSYESTISDAGRIYFLTERDNFSSDLSWGESAPLPLLATAQRSDSVEAATAVVRRIYSYRVDNKVYPLDTLVTQASIGEMFGIRVTEGNLQRALGSPEGLALTESVAKKIFGTVHAVGKIAQVAGKSYVVGAVIEDPPSNSTVYYESLAGQDSSIWSEIRPYIFDSWSFNAAKIYLKLKPGVAASAVTEELQQAADLSPFAKTLDLPTTKKLNNQRPREIRLVALTDAYFNNTADGSQSKSPRGDRKFVLGFELVALAILLLAVTNYVNLASVRTLARQREIAICKILGAGVAQIVAQFMVESVMVALISTGIGLIFSWLLLPIFSEYVDRQLAGQLTPVVLMSAIVLGAVVGILAGAYPAWVALKVRATHTLTGRGSNETIGGLWLRRVLSVMQFATAMGLVALTLAMVWQTQFAILADPGFDAASLLVVQIPKDMTNPASKSLRDAIQRLHGVVGVVASEEPLGRGIGGPGSTPLVKADGGSADVLFRPVSANFFETLGIKPVAGRLFASKIDRDDIDITAPNVIVINQATSRALGYATPQQAVGQNLVTNTWSADKPRMEALRIIGVAPDIRLTSMHELATPRLAYMPFSMTYTLTVKGAGDLGSLETSLNTLAQQYFPNDVVEIRREKSYLEENYLPDLRMARLLGVASLIAVLIAAFGIYVLSSYNLQRLSKQIILRKLHGASVRNIVILVGREFVILIAVGASIGLPISAITIQGYVATFSEHAPIGVWTLFAAFVLALVVTFFSTLRHTVTAMRMAPAQILKELC